MNLVNKVSNKDLIIISKNISELYNEGIHMINIFSLLKDLPLKESYKKSIDDMVLEIENGYTLSKSFKKYKGLYPDFFVEMVSLGESSGRLGEVLKSLSEYYKRKDSLSKNIINSLIYPIFIMIAMVVLALLFIFVILPNFMGMYESMNVEIPFFIKVCWSINNMVKDNTILFFTSFICWGIIPTYLLLKKFKKYTKIIINKISVVKKVTEYKILTIFYILQKSGVNISKGLDFCINSLSEKGLKESLKEIQREIYQGEALSKVFSRMAIFSNYTIAMIRLGEESGNLEGRLENRLIKIEEEIKFLTEKVMTYFQPIVILILAFVVIVAIYTIVIPLLDSIMGGIA